MGACRPDYATRLDSESQIQRDRARVFSELSRLMRGYEAQRTQTLTARMPVEFMAHEMNPSTNGVLSINPKKPNSGAMMRRTRSRTDWP